MPPREVRFPAPELASFLEELDPLPDEIDAVILCLEALKEGPLPGELVPFDQFPEHPEARVIECGRFVIVYAVEDEVVFPVVILLNPEHE